MTPAQLHARAVQRADSLIAKRQNLAFMQWLPLAAIAASLFMPSVRKRASAALSALLWRTLKGLR